MKKTLLFLCSAVMMCMSASALAAAVTASHSDQAPLCTEARSCHNDQERHHAERRHGKHEPEQNIHCDENGYCYIR